MDENMSKQAQAGFGVMMMMMIIVFFCSKSIVFFLCCFLLSKWTEEAEDYTKKIQ
jgi:hypothetical protein